MTTPPPRSSLVKVLSIFAIASAVIAGFGLLGVILYWFFTGVVFIDGVASAAVMLGFLALAWKGRLSWRKPEAAALLIVFMAFIGMCFDSRGNPLYNQPLEWLFAPPGAALQTKEIISHGGGSTGVNYAFRFVDSYGGIVGEVSNWIVIPFRFFEYLLVLSAAMGLLTLVRPAGADWRPPPST
ncbi:hypothetical protein SAMN05216588_10379 [Pseudomonas flavescens]|uniref:Uncharacterized protein n=1 Tax=Phytopseudomonas flavescens TaxID=29435 RepID=A0A1G8A9H0_9GAMM|nr:hypothetical protein [Pseudomonas flavescens]SDH17614.1 hypothetical protein SAMN05216588_10379 [Pseudomonas flavescens]